MYTDKPNNKKNTCYCVGGNFWRLGNHWEPAPQYFFADAPPETDIEDSLLQRDEYIYELQV